MLKSVTTNIRWLISNIPFVGKYLGGKKNDDIKSPDAKTIKAMHTSQESWNDAFFNRLREFGSNIYTSLFHGSLFQLFLRNNSVPEFDPKHFNNYDVKVLDIKSANKQSLGQKYLLSKKNSDGSEPVVVLSHGARTTGRNMGKLAKTLMDSGYRVIAGDLTGFGANKNKHLSPFTLVADVKSTIKEAQQTNPDKALVLIPHSMATALHIKALTEIFKEEEKTGDYKTKVNNLVLVSPWDKISYLINDIRMRDRAMGQIRDQLNQEPISQYVAANQDKAEKIAQKVFGTTWDTIDSLDELLALNKKRPAEFRIKNLNVIHGQEDNFVSYERGKNLINKILYMKDQGETILPNSRFYLIRDGNHFDMQVNDADTYFPITNILQALQKNPQGIEAGEGDFGKLNYTRTQLEKFNSAAPAPATSVAA